jgi:hypothetical protein
MITPIEIEKEKEVTPLPAPQMDKKHTHKRVKAKKQGIETQLAELPVQPPVVKEEIPQPIQTVNPVQTLAENKPRKRAVMVEMDFNDQPPIKDIMQAQAKEKPRFRIGIGSVAAGGWDKGHAASPLKLQTKL